MSSTLFYLFCLAYLTLVTSQCIDNSTDTTGLQNLLTSGGEGYVLSLCAGQVYTITQPLNFTNTSQVR